MIKWNNFKNGQIKNVQKLYLIQTKDDWSKNTSEFGEKIINKSNLLFIIEYTNNNKFRGYVQCWSINIMITSKIKIHLYSHWNQMEEWMEWIVLKLNQI